MNGSAEPTPACRLACPVDKDIPGFLRAIALGDSTEAWRIAYRDTLFPGVLGRICPRPCEPACVLSRHDDPVPVCRLKRWVSEREGTLHGPPTAARGDGPSIAVMGAGPAGLATAHDLAVRGANVTLFDRADEPGGLMLSCIPTFRLPEETVREDVERILALGIRFEAGREFRSTDSLTTLHDEGFDAVVLALGAGDDHVPEFPGWRSPPACWTSIEFLEAFRRGEAELAGPKVLVIGGGLSAIDAARAALRTGGREIRILYRRDRSEMPAGESDIDETTSEGITLHTRVTPVELAWDGDRLRGAIMVRTRPGDAIADGEQRPTAVAGTEALHAADAVISAIGQRHPLHRARDSEQASWLFSCGDFTTGPGTVVGAIASGRRTAAAIWKSLSAAGRWSTPEEAFTQHLADVRPGSGAPSTPSTWVCDRSILHLSRRSAMSEAARCVGCDQVLSLSRDRCILCGQCAERCLEACLSWEADVGTGSWRLEIDDSICARCGDCVDVCPSGALSWKPWTRENKTWVARKNNVA